MQVCIRVRVCVKLTPSFLYTLVTANTYLSCLNIIIRPQMKYMWLTGLKAPCSLSLIRRSQGWLVLNSHSWWRLLGLKWFLLNNKIFCERHLAGKGGIMSGWESIVSSCVERVSRVQALLLLLLPFWKAWSNSAFWKWIEPLGVLLCIA